MEDEKPYVVESATRICLRPEAKFWAQQHGMSLTEMARYLLQQDRLHEAGMTEADVLQGGDEANLNVTEIL
jgi:hypothetical protein